MALAVLVAVDESDAYANLLLPVRIARARLSSRDAGLATELVYGTLRNRGWYDHLLAHCASRPLEDLDVLVLEGLRMGAHQLLDMRVPAHAAISETVEAVKGTKSARAAGMVNAVLRRLSERSVSAWERVIEEETTKEAYLAIRTSHPVWIAHALASALAADGRPDDLPRLLEADDETPRVCLVALPGRADRGGLDPAEYSPVGMYADAGDPVRLTEPGRIRVQDQGSQLAALALARVRPIAVGERWLDVCAGPGGKAALLLAAGRGRVDFTANEPQHHRARLVDDALSPIGLPYRLAEEDGRSLMSGSPSSWDRILLDAPCTGLGALRRRPEARWRKTPADLAALTALQADLLDAAAGALVPGGVLAYTTCSPHLAETQRQIESALRRHPELERLDAADVLRGASASIPIGEQKAGVQLWPHIHHSDAMFISLLRRRR